MARKKSSGSPRQQLMPEAVPPHHNRGLFADYFLGDHSPGRVRDLDDWAHAEGLDEAFQAITQLYRKAERRLRGKPNEAQTEEHFIRPVLKVLWGQDCYEVQAGIPMLGVGQRRPDFAFFRTAADREAARAQGPDAFWRSAPALGDAKVWKEDLDKARAAGDNPSSQISDYLYRSRVRWGILTNGTHWRLYEQDRSRAGGIFYEVNLQELIQRGDPEGFKYFYLFFRRQAFVPGPSGTCFVDQVLQESVRYATAVGDSLKESVYDALCHLMNGLLQDPGNALDPRDPATLKAVHDNCLILLYRILFLLYAEDRDLLDPNHPTYSGLGLCGIQSEINNQLHGGQAYEPVTTRFWAHLCNLFRLIDQGYPKAQIPAYNGGLFSPEKHPHIAHTPQPGTPRWEIGDDRLASVIDLLAFQRARWDQPGTEHVDYATLDVQHLGSIYEGLLELQPRVADEPMAETTEKGKPVFKPASQVPTPRPIKGAPPRTVVAGEVYLATDRGERKATGSYYTPKYIVDYIVENTVGPLADEAARKAAERKPEVEKELRRLNGVKKQWKSKKTIGGRRNFLGSSYTAAGGAEDIATQAERAKLRLLEPYLELKILDPAMGSGHFLVGAADFLSMAMATDPSIEKKLRLAAIGEESDQAFYKRLVVERCLYGVDLNPLAVELAKLSLWLHTVSRDKALSFLDHHMRCGNSLIGARIEQDLMSPPPENDKRGKVKRDTSGQRVLGFAEALTTQHLSGFLDTFRQIVERPSATAEDAHLKDRLYREMDSARDRYRAVADLWLAPYFGVPIHIAQYAQAVAALGGTPADWAALTRQPWFEQAQAIAQVKHFFHWELEFPEVFFGAQGFMPADRRGFDAAIGNPPWLGLRTGDMEADLLTFMRSRFKTAVGQFDLAATFLELGDVLSHTGGRLGNVIPKRLATNECYEDLRKAMARARDLHSAVDLGVAFVEVDNDALILISWPAGSCRQRVLFGKRVGADAIETWPMRDVAIGSLPFCIIPVNSAPEAVRLAARIAQGAVTPLGQLVTITRGAECGMNHPAISRKRTAGALRLLDHLDMSRHHVSHSGWFIDPARIEPSVLKPRELYETVPKLLIRFLSADVVAAKDAVGYASTNLLYHVQCGGETDFLCAVLCSKVLSFWYGTAFQNEEVKFPHVQKSHLITLPIRRIGFTTPSAERGRLVAKGKRLYNDAVERLTRGGQ